MSDEPRRRRFLTAEWRDLVIANFEVAPERLHTLTPAGTELDLFEGKALVSLVGFRFIRTRVLGLPIPFHVNFPEVNLRFYVKRRTHSGEVRRAVTFVRELVPRRAIAWVAHWLYEEPYRALPMRSTTTEDRSPSGHERRAEYAWKCAGRWHRIGATATGEPEVPPPDSEASFTIEHYWGYTARRDGRTQEFEVVHPRWRVWTVRSHTLDLDAGASYGPAWSDLLAHAPTTVILAEGSPIAVHLGRRLPLQQSASAHVPTH